MYAPDDPEEDVTRRSAPARPPLLGGLGAGIWFAVILVIVWGDLLIAENWRSGVHMAGYAFGLPIGTAGAFLLRVGPQPDPRRALLGCGGMVVLVAAVFSPRIIGEIASGVSPGTVIGFAGTRLVQIIRYLRATRGRGPRRP